jgi:hypothetical protein
MGDVVRVCGQWILRYKCRIVNCKYATVGVGGYSIKYNVTKINRKI